MTEQLETIETALGQNVHLSDGLGMTKKALKYKNFVKYKCGHPSAVEHTMHDGTFAIILNFTQPNIVLGVGESKDLAWENAYKKLVNA